MAHAFAVIDTSVLILLCTERVDDSPKEIEAERRREAARRWIEHLTPRVRFAVPTPVIAELSRPHSPAGFLELLARSVGRFRVLPLTRSAAETAARMAAARLATKPADRGAVKFDTLIAAIAHEARALYLLTDDRRDYNAPLQVVTSSVEIVVASNPRPGEQMQIVPLAPKKK